MAVALLQLVDGLQRALRGRARAEDRAARLTAYVEELGAAERLSPALAGLQLLLPRPIPVRRQIAPPSNQRCTNDRPVTGRLPRRRFLEAFGSGDLDAMLAPFDRDVVDGSLVVRWISARGRISVGARWASAATGYATCQPPGKPDPGTPGRRLPYCRPASFAYKATFEE